MARFFLASTDPHYLKDAPGGATLSDRGRRDACERGKIVFAERCARCHSSKLPPLPAGLDLENANGPDYLAALEPVLDLDEDRRASRRRCARSCSADDFLKDNFLSTELRVPITLLGINACSPLATNAIRDNIWDNFSSESYKQLPSVGRDQDPSSGDRQGQATIRCRRGGRGYIRPASLVSVWSTAPFLQNNTVGPFIRDPSVEARMESFEDIDRADAVARDAARKTAIFGTRRTRRRHHRSDDRRQLSRGARGYIPTALRPLVCAGRGCSRSSAAPATRSRSDPSRRVSRSA